MTTNAFLAIILQCLLLKSFFSGGWASPRIRDFRGLSAKGFDGRGNYNFGVNEQIIFPEIDYDKVKNIKGLNIAVVTSGETDEEAYELLVSMGMPIRQKKKISEEGVEV